MNQKQQKNGDIRTTKEVLKTTVLEDEEFSLLRKYLKENLGISDEDIELDMQIVIQQ